MTRSTEIEATSRGDEAILERDMLILRALLSSLTMMGEAEYHDTDDFRAIEARAVELAETMPPFLDRVDITWVYRCQSAAVLEALTPPSKPASERRDVSPDVVRDMPQDVYATAVRRGYLYAGHGDRLLSHLPDCSEWTRILCEEISPRHHITSRSGWLFWGRASVDEEIPTERYARVMRAQVRDQPRMMSHDLRHSLGSERTSLRPAAALILAGARVDERDTIAKGDDEARALLDQSRSNHGLLEIAARYGTLEDCIDRMRGY